MKKRSFFVLETYSGDMMIGDIALGGSALDVGGGSGGAQSQDFGSSATLIET